MNGPSLYAHALNSPQMYTDPDGRFVPLVAVAGGALVGGGIDLAIQLYREDGDFSCVDWKSVAVAAGIGATASGVFSGASRGVQALRGILKPKGAPSVDANKLNHIFGRAQHGLDDLVQSYGSQQAAYSAIQRATQSAVNASGTTGVFQTTVRVGGQNVTMRGRVIDGVAKIGTAYK